MPGLLRLLIIGLIIWLLFQLLKRGFSALPKSKTERPSQIDTMVRCQQCGLHIPEKEAIKSDNVYYCSKEHQRLEQDKS